MSPIIGIMASANWSSANASSFESIASASGTGSSGTITFSSIPSTYQHLQVRLLGNTSTTQASWGVRLNGSSTATDYTAHKLTGNGSTATAGAYANNTNTYLWCGETGGVAANMNVAIIDIQDYALTTNKKTIRTFTGVDNNSTIGFVTLSSGLYMQSTAISSLTIYCGSNWSSTTQVALYGIKGA